MNAARLLGGVGGGLAAALIVLAGAPGAPGRLWTSAEGDVLEAELAGRDGDFVILDSAGRRFRIDIRHLSEADRAYLETAAAPAAAPPGGAGTAAGPGPVSFRAPPAMTSEQLPGLESLDPSATSHLGLQFGPAPADVLYLSIEIPDPQQLPETLAVFSPGHPTFATPRRLTGRKDRQNDHRVMRFSGLHVSSRFGPLGASYNVEVICGIGRPDVIALLIEIELVDQGKSGTLVLGGFVTDRMRTGPGEIPILRALGPPTLRASVDTRREPPAVSPRLTMGPFAVRPAGKEIEIRVMTESGRTAEKLDYAIKEEDLLSLSGAVRPVLDDLKPATPYVLEAAADLGPGLGRITHTARFITAADEP